MDEGRTVVSDVLPLTVGMTVEVMTMNNQITFVGKVERYTGEVLTVREATGGELPPVLFNQEVKLHFFRGDQSIIVAACVCGSNARLWKLDRMERLFGQEQRMFFRQSVKVAAKVQRMEEPKAKTGEEQDQEEQEVIPVPCKILDASANGLRLSTREHFQTGDQLLVTEAVFVRGDKPFEFHCRVLRVSKEGGNYLYGCQIEGLSDKEQDRLLRAIFIVQRNERQNQREY